MHRDSLKNYEEYVKAKKDSLSSLVPVDNRRVYCTFSQTKFNENIINYVMRGFVPFNTVEDASFRQIFEGLYLSNTFHAKVSVIQNFYLLIKFSKRNL